MTQHHGYFELRILQLQLTVRAPDLQTAYHELLERKKQVIEWAHAAEGDEGGKRAEVRLKSVAEEPMEKKKRPMVWTLGRIGAFVLAAAGTSILMLIVSRAVWAKFGLTFSASILTSPVFPIAVFSLVLVTAYAIELTIIGYEKSSLRMLLRFDRQIR